MSAATYEQAGRVVTLSESALSRLSSSIEVHPVGCWPWLGRLDRDGYGVIKVNKRTISFAHRVVYQIFHDVHLGTEQQIDHLCFNRRCCNPAHLDVVDNRTNKIRSVIYHGVRREIGGRCRHGHALIGTNVVIAAGRVCCRRCRRRTQSAYRTRRRQG